MLVDAHNREVAHHPEVELQPDIVGFMEAEDSHRLAIFTARAESSELVGYAIFTLAHDSHRAEVKAIANVVYLKPEHRGHYGRELLSYADLCLKDLGAKAIYHSVTTKRDFGPVLTRMGYAHTETIYSRRF